MGMAPAGSGRHLRGSEGSVGRCAELAGLGQLCSSFWNSESMFAIVFVRAWLYGCVHVGVRMKRIDDAAKSKLCDKNQVSKSKIHSSNIAVSHSFSLSHQDEDSNSELSKLLLDYCTDQPIG